VRHTCGLSSLQEYVHVGIGCFQQRIYHITLLPSTVRYSTIDLRGSLPLPHPDTPTPRPLRVTSPTPLCMCPHHIRLSSSSRIYLHITSFDYVPTRTPDLDSAAYMFNVYMHNYNLYTRYHRYRHWWSPTFCNLFCLHPHNSSRLILDLGSFSSSFC
jgi:hypothetical protein